MKSTFYFIIILFGLAIICPAQTTHNLEIIFQRGTPDTSLRYWGNTIAGVGDVNSDGYDDVAIAAYTRNTWFPKVFVFYGNSSGLDTVYDLLIAPPLDNINLSIAGGDINGDGYSDIILGCSGNNPKIWIYHGGSAMDSTADIVFGGIQIPNYMSYAAVATGDLNGDDTADLIVGDYWNTNGDGHVYVYEGSVSFDTIPWLEIKGHGGEGLGMTITSGADINGDSIDDLLIGASANSEYAGWAGKIYLFEGGIGIDTIPEWWKHGEGGSQFWGEAPGALCKANDYGRIWCGSYYFPGGWLSSQNNGKAVLFYGGDTLDSIPDMTIVGPDSQTGIGTWFSSGLLDSNNIGDLICGSWEIGSVGKGSIWDGTAIQDTTLDAWIEGRWVSDALGVSNCNSGDVDGDSVNEVMFANNDNTNRIVMICKYTGPNGTVQHEPGFTSSRTVLSQNIPNPFMHSTTIDYKLFQKEWTTLKVYNISGQLVKVLVDGIKLPGFYNTVWNGLDMNGTSVAAGIYFYKLKTDNKSLTKKMIKVK